VPEHTSSDSHDTPIFTNSNAELNGVELRIPVGIGGKREQDHLITGLTYSAA
jgi:hypothetical protein